MKKLILLSALVIFMTNLNAQILGGIMNEAKRKLERKIENKIIEAVSEELARRAFKPIEAAIDSVMREKYRDSINGGKEVDWEKAGSAYAEFLAGMNKVVDLPEKYTFDISQEVEIKDYSNKVNQMRLHYSKNEAIIGMEDLESKKTTQFIVIDVSRDAMVIFTTDKNGKKSGQAIPSVMKMTAALASSVRDPETGKPFEMKIEKTGKKKKIAGYQSLEYKGNTDKEDFIMYISPDFPVSWQKNYTRYFSQFAPASYTENVINVENGIMLEYINTDKKEEKSTSWSTVKVNEKTFSIEKSEYSFDKK